MKLEQVVKTMFTEYPDVASLKQLSHMLHQNYKICIQKLKNGEIPYFRMGRNYLIPKIFVIEYIFKKSTPIFDK